MALWEIAAAYSAVLLYLAFNIVAALHAYRFTRVVPESKAPARAYASLWERLRLGLTGAPSVRHLVVQSPESVELAYEDVALIASDGRRLAAWWIPCEGASSSILLFHGWGANREELLPYARMFHDAGFHVFMPDFRGCGQSAGDVVTFGERESLDVEAAVRYAQARAPGPIGALGFSMGGAALARYLSKRKDHGIAVAVFESTYSSLVDTAAHRFWHAYRLPKLFAWALVWWGGIFTGFAALRLAPVRYLKRVQIPAFFISGTEDFRVPPRDTMKLFKAAKGEKQLWILDEHGHARALEAAPEEFEGRVLPFVGKYLPRHGGIQRPGTAKGLHPFEPPIWAMRDSNPRPPD